MPFTVPLSRTFAASLCLVAGPATSLDLALWLGTVADALILVDDPDEHGLTMRDAWTTAEGDEAPLFMAASTLLQATGLRTHAQLERPFERLSDTSWSLGLHGDHRLRLWHGWEASPADRGNPVDRGIVSGLALAQAMIHEVRFTVSVNVGAMARFRSRYSALIYMRALAWLTGAGTPKSWKRTPPGKGRPVSVTVPVDELHRALGTDSLRMVGDWNAKAFGRDAKGGPVHEDLASTGIRLRTEWIMASAGYGARQVPTALRLTVSRIAGAERRPPTRRPRQSSQASSRSSASSMP